jgi:hypothetical protein
LTETGTELHGWLVPSLRDALELLERAEFQQSFARVEAARALLKGFDRTAATEDALKDLFVLSQYVDLIEAYIQLWQFIWEANYPASWNSLQDALDALRLIKKFSQLNIEYFEEQLLQLETGYPYKIFASIGAVVDHFECSICGKDIDDFECEHRRGELYGDRMAIGIARNIVALDHVSLVFNPVDKRCVVQLDNSAQQFRVLAYIRRQWHEGALRAGHLRRLEWSKRMIANPDYHELGRNERCYCGSKEKFKHCCIGKRFTEQDHVNLVGEPRDIRTAISPLQ